MRVRPHSKLSGPDDVSAALANAAVSRLRLRQLRLLQVLRKHRTVNGAAAALGISQPASYNTIVVGAGVQPPALILETLSLRRWRWHCPWTAMR